MKDKVNSYLKGLSITVPRYIPTFSEARRTELLDIPKPFKLPTWTRTFVAFNPTNHFKILDGFEFLETLKPENLSDGFLPIRGEQYHNLHAREFECTSSKTMNKTLAYTRKIS